MIAILEAHRAGLLGRAHWARNIVSGIVVGVVLVAPCLSVLKRVPVRNGYRL